MMRAWTPPPDGEDAMNAKMAALEAAEEAERQAYDAAERTRLAKGNRKQRRALAAQLRRGS
jgi:hypothetical protein